MSIAYQKNPILAVKDTTYGYAPRHQGEHIYKR